MHLFRLALALFSLLFLLNQAPAAHPDPLQWAPERADLIVKIDQPRLLLDAVTSNEVFKQLQTFPPFLEFYDSGPFRRFFEILYYFERELGANRYELLDRLAGNGAVFAIHFGEPSYVLLVIQGKDEALLQKFKATGLRVLESELARLDVKEPIQKGSHRGLEGVRIGKDLFAATVGTALVMTNASKGLEAALNQHLDKGRSAADNPQVGAARRLLPPDPLAWGYLGMGLLRESPQFKALFTTPNENPAVPLLIGGYVDVLRRAPYATAGLYRRASGLHATLRMPAGYEGSAVEASPHIPPAGQPGSRPLLQPKNTLFSTSYFLDLGKIWEHRMKLLGEQGVEVINGIDKELSQLPGGASLSKLMEMMGPYQRFVVAAQDKPSYKIAPAQQLPAFALVLEMRDPKGLKPIVDLALRGGAVAATAQFGLKYAEEKVGEHTLVSYRFDEARKIAQDTNNLRFNFSPCFAFVGNQFLACSTQELARELIAALDQEAAGGLEATGRPNNPASSRTLLAGAGGAVVLRQLEEQLFVQAMLERALTPEAAKKQLQSTYDILQRLGTLSFGATYGAKEFRYDFELQWGK